MIKRLMRKFRQFDWTKRSHVGCINIYGIDLLIKIRTTRTCTYVCARLDAAVLCDTRRGF